MITSRMLRCAPGEYVTVTMNDEGGVPMRLNIVGCALVALACIVLLPSHARAQSAIAGVVKEALHLCRG